MLLPAPLSPTSPRTSPGFDRGRRCAAAASPRSGVSAIERSGSRGSALLIEHRIEALLQPFAELAEGEHGQEQHDQREHQHPPGEWMMVRPSAIMPPQVGSSVEMERLTKERIASTMTAMPISQRRAARRSPAIRWAALPSREWRPRRSRRRGRCRHSPCALWLQRLGAHHPAEPDPVDDDDGDDHRMQAGSEHRHQQDAEKDRREGHPDIDDARHDLVDASRR